HSLTSGRLRWASLGPVYDEFYYPEGVYIGFPDSPAQFRENLASAFPGEVAAIDGYFARVREVAGAMRRYYLARLAPPRLATAADLLFARTAQAAFQARTADVVGALTQDPRLRTALCGQWGYYGSTPSRSSFAMQALVTKHFLHGGYYPEGGSSEIARCLLRTVADAGGWTRIRSDVAEILVEDGAAIGVRLADGEELRARRVVSAVGVMSTVTRLLPPAHRDAAWARSIDQLSPAPAHVCLYLGFRGDIREAGAGAANKWFWSTWDVEADGWDVAP
ncbi:MAG: FAD-dependent oxidoreductase, partial [Myxococcales bacterium]|nr:FAD-dependent oxidoreductase [Myxococcales bacterium]